MGQKTFTDTGLFYLLLILWAVWYLMAAFAEPPFWFQTVGVVALFLTFFRIEAYGIPVVALRFFNVNGRHQMFSNLYTGVLTVFAWRLLNDRVPLLFEDGLQQRDFVHVNDAVAARCNAMDMIDSGCRVYNIGGSRSATVLDVATMLARITGREHIPPEISGRHR